MSFIKLYHNDQDDGYVNSACIIYFDFEYIPGKTEEDDHYLVKACKEGQKVEDGLQVSHKIKTRLLAELYLDSLIENLR